MPLARLSASANIGVGLYSPRGMLGSTMETFGVGEEIVVQLLPIVVAICISNIF